MQPFIQSIHTTSYNTFFLLTGDLDIIMKIFMICRNNYLWTFINNISLHMCVVALSSALIYWLPAVEYQIKYGMNKHHK